MAKRDCADARSSVWTCCWTDVAETSSSHCAPSACFQVGRTLRITTGHTVTSTKAVETRPSSDMLVPELVPVTRSWADVPETLRSRASASRREAPTELRAEVSLMGHPSLFAT